MNDEWRTFALVLLEDKKYGLMASAEKSPPYEHAIQSCIEWYKYHSSNIDYGSRLQDLYKQYPPIVSLLAAMWGRNGVQEWAIMDVCVWYAKMQTPSVVSEEYNQYRMLPLVYEAHQYFTRIRRERNEHR